jgi:hypothetical protein
VGGARAHNPGLGRGRGRRCDRRRRSQAILGQFPDAPDSLLVSQEADVFPREQPGLAERIDGALGEGSAFHEAFGYYAHGVGPETAKAPAGWQERLIAIEVGLLPSGDPVVGLCLEVHDLALAKAAAGRERDWDFVAELLRHQLVDFDVLIERLPDLPVSEPARDRLRDMLVGIVTRVRRRRQPDAQ